MALSAVVHRRSRRRVLSLLSLTALLTTALVGGSAVVTYASLTSVSVGTQSPNPIAPGGTATYTVNVTNSSGSTARAVSLTSVTGLPAGAAWSAPQCLVVAGDGNPDAYTLTITTTGATPVGTSTITVTATRWQNTTAVCSGTVNETLAGTGSLVVRNLTTTSITADSPDPSTVGAAYTVDVSVTRSSGSAAITGTVTVSDGTSSCNDATPTGGSAATVTYSCSLTSTTSGAKTLTATYPGDSSYGTSSDTESHTVNAVSTTTTITSDSPDPSTVGQAYVVNVSVTRSSGSADITGTVTVSDGTDSCSDTGASGGSAATVTYSCNLTSTTAGARTLTATYAGNATYAGSSGTTSHTVNQASTTTSITGDSPDPSTMGAAYTVNVSVTRSAGTVAISGGVTVSDGTDSCSDGAPSGSGPTFTYSCSLTSTTSGSKTLAATYAGDANYAGSSDNESHVVKATTTTAITSDAPDPSLIGAAYTVDVSVTRAAGSAAITGTMSVSDGTSNCTDTTPTGGTAATVTYSCSLTSSTSGAKTLTATYPGDSSYAGSSGTTSHDVDKIPTTTAITSDSPDPSTVDASYTVNVSVTRSSGSASITGTVTVSDGTDSCTDSGPSGGPTTVTYSCSLTSTTNGAKTLTASYPGNTTYDISSGTASHQVDAVSTTTTITSDSPDPSNAGTAYTVGVSVARGSDHGNITGTVTVSDGTDNCTVTLSGSGSPRTGSCSLTSTTSGAKTLTATYSGNTKYAGSSDTESHTVNAVSTTTTITSDSPDPSTVGQAYTVNVSVARSSGSAAIAGTVAVSDGAGATCTVTLSGTGSPLTGSCSLTSTTSGAKTLTATYSGSGIYSGSSDTESHAVNKNATTTAITGDSPDPSLVGQSYTVNVSVTRSTGTADVTGSVAVSDGTGGTCNATLSGSGATATGSCSLASSTAGAKTLTATYSGDGAYLGSSDTESHAVNPAATTTTVVSSLAPSIHGQLVTFTATVAADAPGAGTPTGTIEFFDDAVSLGTVALVAGEATLDTSALPVGLHMIGAIYSGDANFVTSSSTISQIVGFVGTTTAITSDLPDPTVTGQPYTVAVSVTRGSGSVDVTGTVAVDDGIGNSCIVTLAGPGATATGSCSLPSTAGGVRTLTATYSGDAVHSGSSDTDSHAVDHAATTTVVTSNINPIVYGETLWLTATITVNPPGAGVPYGNAEFFDGAVSIGTAPLIGGQADLGITSLSIGSHSITAVFDGNPDFASSTSSAYTQVVDPVATTTLITADNPDPSITGQPYNVEVSVTRSSGAVDVTGTVAVSDGTGGTCNAILSGSGNTAIGQCTLISTSAGAKTLTAGYPGDGIHTASSGTAAHTVNPATTTTALVSSLSPSTHGDPVTFTVTVAVTSPGSGSPTGNVEFFDDAASLGSVALTAGQASLGTSALPVGLHTISAIYSGDADFVTSSSAITQIVLHVGTTTSITSDLPDPSFTGQSYTVDVSVTRNAGTVDVTGTVTVSDGVDSCTDSTPAGGSAATVTYSCALASTAAGPRTLTATYGGDPVHSGSSGTAGHSVDQAGTTTVVASGLNPSVLGVTVTFTATVSVTAPGAGTPAGTVEFFDGLTSLGTAPLLAGTSSLDSSSLGVGSHSITAVYSGDADFATSTSAAITQEVLRIGTTTSITNDLPDPSVAGQSYTVDVSVTRASGSADITGTVAVIDGAGGTCNAALSGSGATATGSCSLVSTTAGAKTLTATYSGDGAYLGSFATASHLVNPAATTISLGSDINPSLVGHVVTFTAVVSVDSPGAGTPLGTVEFFDGATSLGTAPLAALAASISTSALGVGSHSITAIYSGDASFTGDTSPVLAQVVTTIGTTTTITSDSPDPSIVGQPYAVNVSVTRSAGSADVSGSVTVVDGAGATCTATLSGSGATATGSCSLVSTTAGAKTLTASYSGDAVYAASSGSAGHQVNAAATSVALVADVNPTVLGQTVIFSATVSAVSPGAGLPGGSVEFFDGATSLGVASGNPAMLGTSGLTVGSHSITAVYLGGPDYQGSTSPVLTQVVNTIPTTTSITSDAPDPSEINGSYTVNVTVAGASGAGWPGGSVAISDGAGGTCSATLSPGGPAASTGSCTMASSSAGAKTLTASYPGDASFGGSSDTESHAVAQASTSTSIASDINPSVLGQTVTFTAAVTTAPGMPTPTGSVEFFDGATSLGSAAVSAGEATLSTAVLSIGSHSITAVYGGDSNLATSASPALSQVVNAIATTTTITSDSPDPSVVGEPYTVTVGVARSAGTLDITGSVGVSDGAGATCTATLAGSGGTATGSCTLTPAAAGAVTITAGYLGDSVYLPSSDTEGHVVNAAATSTAVASDINPSTVGQTVTFTATVSATAPGSGTPAGTLEFFDGATPLGAPVALAGGQATLAISALNIGTHQVHAVYNGGADFTGSTSPDLEQVVGVNGTTTAITADSPDPSELVGSYTVDVIVARVAGPDTPGGTVDVSDGAGASCQVVLAPTGDGTAAGSCTLASTVAGPKTITATYSGDPNLGGSSDTEAHSVAQAPGSVVLSSNRNPSLVDDLVTFTATVAPIPGAPEPGGAVEFFDGAGSLGAPVPVVGGHATFETALLALGPHVLTAVYSGDGNLIGSTSGELVQSVIEVFVAPEPLAPSLPPTPCELLGTCPTPTPESSPAVTPSPSPEPTGSVAPATGTPAPSAEPTGGVEPATGRPRTPPAVLPQTTSDGTGTPGGLPLVFLVLALGIGGLFLVTPRPRRVRR